MDLRELCSKLFKADYQETLRVQIHPSCLLRAIFFADQKLAQNELPLEFQL